MTTPTFHIGQRVQDIPSGEYGEVTDLHLGTNTGDYIAVRYPSRSVLTSTVLVSTTSRYQTYRRWMTSSHPLTPPVKADR